MGSKQTCSNIVLLLGLWLVWGYSWVASKVGLAFATPLQMAEYRLSFAVLTLGGLLLWRRSSLRPPPLWPTLWLGLTQTTGFTLLSTLALLTAGTGKVTVLCYTMPFWTLLLARIFLNERISPQQWLAVALAFSGLICVLEPWLGASWQGELLAIGAGISWAISAIVAKRLRAKHQIDTLDLTFWQLLLGLIPLFGISFAFEQPAVNWQPAFWLVLIFNGCIAAGLGWLVWLHLLSRLSASTAGLNVLAIPAVALLCAWLQLDDVPSLAEGVGIALIALALGLLATMNHFLDRAAVASQ
ncbi:MAG: DMT family transporter [Aeromonadaceae bacterium]